MSMKCLERAFSLLIAVLMITTAFIPAVGAAEPNRAASSVNPGFPVTHNDVEVNKVLNAFDCYLVERLSVF